MKVQKDPCIPLKLSDVFSPEKPSESKCNGRQLDKTNKEKFKKKSWSILNKYKITEFNKSEKNDIRIRNKIFVENRINKEIGGQSSDDRRIELCDRNNGDSYDHSEKVKTKVETENRNNALKDCKKRKVYKKSNLLIANGTTGIIVHNGIMCLSMKGIQPFIVSSVKKSFCIYDMHKLRKAFISDYYSEDIKNLYFAKNCVYVVFNKKVYRVNETGGRKVFFSNDHKYNIIDIFVVTDYLLTYSKKEIILWDDQCNDDEAFSVSNSCSEDSSQEDGHGDRDKDVERDGDKVGDRDDDEVGERDGNKDGERDSDKVGEQDNDKHIEEKGDDRKNENASEQCTGNGKLSCQGDGQDGTWASNKSCKEGKELIGKNSVKKNNDYVFKCILLFDDNSDVEIKCIYHPDGYINKVIILTNENKLYLYNINKEKIIHEYVSINKVNFNKGKFIKLMSGTLKREELYVVTSNNELYIINIEKDEIVYSKNIHMNDDTITCVSFFNYKHNGEEICAVLLGTEHGKILMINSKSIQYFILRNVHDHVKNILISPQGYIYTAGYDNTINLLNVNKSTFTLDIIKKRNSCIGIINNIKYIDDEHFKLLVSANIPDKKEGNLFIICPHNPEQNKEFSWNKRINILDKTIIDFDINTNRHYDWNNILICLNKLDRVYLASSYRKTVANEYLLLPSNIMNKQQKQMKSKNFINNADNNGVLKDDACEDNNFIDEHNDDTEEYKIYDEHNSFDYNINLKKIYKYATSVLISTCGHIGIVGYSDGEIHSFNMQSTTYRNEYKLNKYSFKSKAHTDGLILKLYLYGVNYFVSASNSREDTCLRVWNIYTSELTYSYNVRSEYINSCSSNSIGGNGLVNTSSNSDEVSEDIYISSFYHFSILTVVCLSNKHILIVDIEQKCITRKFRFSFSVTYVTFSKDNRLIFFALNNHTLLIYEIISNTFVDYLLFKNDIISMIYNDMYLHTAHKNNYNFLNSFTNKNLFNNNKNNYFVNDYKLINAIPIEDFSDTDDNYFYKCTNLKELINMKNNDIDNTYNNTLCLNEQNNDKDASLNEKGGNNYTHLIQSYTSREKQINKNLLTMSGFNMSKIAYIIFLDKIKEKCKVEENVKRNEQIPFFLTAKLEKNIEYVDNKEKEFLENITKNVFNKREQIEDQEAEEEKHDEATEKVNNRNVVRKRQIFNRYKPPMPLSKLQEILAKNEFSYINVLKYLKSLSPSGVHFNILSLSSKEELENMMNFFIYHVKTNDNIDLIQAYILIFLKAHGRRLIKIKEKNLRNTTNVLLQEIQGSWSNINFLFENIIFFIKFLTNIQLE
ncbi:U3 small nucleolar RNA-associated protein 21, putative [Plasmodium malariae]|uniref:U3 small nucleolar RNA-associated protein 21, putative n=1 Tax=Plasmodium malariae TaxID=5858 RepID=A0A1D3SNT5_PLAMA|nr:U3 small nucleolar RNA-associated protein 21, putative [Plasmodium malariae]SCO93032.1 U3 small nucleolar RNA-associated protein 21, putative [Plasmodium malariae]